MLLLHVNCIFLSIYLQNNTKNPPQMATNTTQTKRAKPVGCSKDLNHDCERNGGRNEKMIITRQHLRLEHHWTKGRSVKLRQTTEYQSFYLLYNRCLKLLPAFTSPCQSTNSIYFMHGILLEQIPIVSQLCYFLLDTLIHIK